MKNLIALIAMVFLASVVFSQTPSTQEVKKKTTSKTEVAAPGEKQVAKPGEKAVSKSTTEVKKEVVKPGEKAGAKATSAMKKDSATVKHAKENKDAAKMKATETGKHLKKDGTPDMRYKQNKGTTTTKETKETTTKETK